MRNDIAAHVKDLADAIRDRKLRPVRANRGVGIRLHDPRTTVSVSANTIDGNSGQQPRALDLGR